MKIKLLMLFGIVSITLLSFSASSFVNSEIPQQNYSEIIEGFNQGEETNNIVNYSDRLKSYSNSDSNEYSINYSERLVGFSNHNLYFSSSSYADIISSFTHRSDEIV